MIYERGLALCSKMGASNLMPWFFNTSYKGHDAFGTSRSVRAPCIGSFPVEPDRRKVSSSRATVDKVEAGLFWLVWSIENLGFSNR
jgi:hypothetical protein